MKRSILLIFATIFFMAGEMFGGSVVTQRVVNACGFVKGSTTLSLSGQMNAAAMQSISSGNAMAVYNYLDSYLTFPTVFPKTKAGYGEKTKTRNVSINAKNGKFKWKEKDVTNCFAFATGGERIRPDKAVLKSQGTIDTANLAELETKRLTVYDKLCGDHRLGDLASLVFALQQKGKNYKFSYNENDIQAKVSVDSKGRVTAKYALSSEAAFPATLEKERIFTNKYDYTLVIVGDGDVRSAFYGPDKVEFRVAENVDKFRYFAYKDTKVTNVFMTLELEDDTEVQAVFGSYDFSLEIVGNGSASAEFIGPDEVEVKVTENKDKFRYFTVNGERCPDSEMTLVLEEDTAVEAVFGSYDFSLEIVGNGSASAEFIGPDEVEVKVTENKDKFRYFTVNGERCPDSEMTLVLEEDTAVEAVFGSYDFSLEIVGNGSASAEFIGPDEVEVKVTENKDKFRYFTVNGERCPDSEMTLVLEEDTAAEAVFGTYDLRLSVFGKGSASYAFVGPDEVVIRAVNGEEFFDYYEWDENVSYENPLKLTLAKDTELLAAFKEGKKFLVVDLSAGADAESYPVSWLDDEPEGGWTKEYKTTKLVLRRIEPGTFMMGNSYRYRKVTLTKVFYIGVFEMTQGQYELITGENPSRYRGADRPMENTTQARLRGADKGAAWPESYEIDEDSFFGKFRAKTSLTFDLPTEAQWEYACRAGTTTDLNSGKNLNEQNLREVGRFRYNADDGKSRYKEHAAVGSYLPNNWGLYDMHGNIFELCLDWYKPILDSDEVIDPKGQKDEKMGNYRVARGGGWLCAAEDCCSYTRWGITPDGKGISAYGFRAAIIQE